MILALDQATTCGWAAGRPGQTPQWGEWNFRSKGGNGEVLCKFHKQLVATCRELQPTVIVFESPYIPRANFADDGTPTLWRGAAGSRFKKAGPPPMNALTLRLLLSMAGIIDAVAFELGVECWEARPDEISKFFLGNAGRGRDEKKAATVKMCRVYGWDTTSDNQADALALWALAEHTIAPQIGSRRAATLRRELPLHGTL